MYNGREWLLCDVTVYPTPPLYYIIKFNLCQLSKNTFSKLGNYEKILNASLIIRILGRKRFVISTILSTQATLATFRNRDVYFIVEAP